jgi:hypothetical protein
MIRCIAYTFHKFTIKSKEKVEERSIMSLHLRVFPMLLKIRSDEVAGARSKYFYRNMCPLMIDVDECSLHIGENFDLILEFLAYIVSLP